MTDCPPGKTHKRHYPVGQAFLLSEWQSISRNRGITPSQEQLHRETQ